MIFFFVTSQTQVHIITNELCAELFSQTHSQIWILNVFSGIFQPSQWNTCGITRIVKKNQLPCKNMKWNSLEQMLYCVFITDSAGDWLVLQSHQVFSSGTVNLIAISTCTIKQKVKKKSNSLNMCSEASVPVRRFNDLCGQWWMPSLGHQVGRLVLISFVGIVWNITPWFCVLCHRAVKHIFWPCEIFFIQAHCMFSSLCIVTLD